MNAAEKAEALASIRQDLGGLGLGLVLGAVACYFVRPRKKATNALEMAQRWLAWGLLGSVSSGVSFWVRNYDKGGILGAAITVLFFSGLAWGLGYVWGLIKFPAVAKVASNQSGNTTGPHSGVIFAAVVGLGILGLVALSAVKSKSGALNYENWWEEPGAVETALEKVGVQTIDLKTLKRMAGEGNAHAQYSLGLVYLHGTGSNGAPNTIVVAENAAVDLRIADKNPEAAVDLLQKAAEQGHAEALLNLGRCYFSGNGVAKDQDKAAELFEQAADAGLAEAQRLIAICYQNGWGKTKSPSRASEWYGKAAQQGDAPAQLEVGRQYLAGEATTMSLSGKGGWYNLDERTPAELAQDESEGAAWVLKAAEQGNVKAQFYMGKLYQWGKGIPRDNAAGVAWLQKAAKEEHAGAQVELAWAYSRGEGVTKDQKNAVEWFSRAAKQGNAEAQGAIGLCYAEGRGVIKDEKTGLAWLYVAIANEDNLHEQSSILIREQIKALERAIGREQTLNAQELAKTLLPSQEVAASN